MHGQPHIRVTPSLLFKLADLMETWKCEKLVFHSAGKEILSLLWHYPEPAECILHHTLIHYFFKINFIY